MIVKYIQRMLKARVKEVRNLIFAQIVDMELMGIRRWQSQSLKDYKDKYE